MKILITHPKSTSAIGRLAADVVKYNPHHEFRVIEIHPKRPDPLNLELFKEAYEWCDVWDCEYWKSGETVRNHFGEAFFTKPSIIAHMNPYDLLQRDWANYDLSYVNNLTQQSVLKTATHIPLGVDLEKFKWNQEYTDRRTVCMVAQRIEGSKGVLPVAQACKRLGYTFILVGEVSDAGYFEQVIKEGNVNFRERISDEELLEVYSQSAIHVCNSKDDFESGTMPIMEAMAVGCPVLTRRVGHVPDLFNEKNMMVRDGSPEDVDELEALLRMMMEDRNLRLQMREDAWHTIRNYSAVRRARRLSSLYYKVGFEYALVSVVMPIFGKPESIQPMIDALDAQTWAAMELIFVSDGDEQFDDMAFVSKKHTVKYYRVGDKEKYGLGYASDYGVMKAEGPIIVFLEQRFLPAPDMIEHFVTGLRTKQWLYANKNGKRSFVENVSCIYRQEYIEMGMRNHLMTGYGGMSQELRSRSKAQGFKHIFVEKAVATAQYSSHNYSSKKDQIFEMKEILWNLNLGG